MAESGFECPGAHDGETGDGGVAAGIAAGGAGLPGGAGGGADGAAGVPGGLGGGGVQHRLAEPQGAECGRQQAEMKAILDRMARFADERGDAAGAAALRRGVYLAARAVESVADRDDGQAAGL